MFTFLHPFYARQVFPCFDEPQFKSTFDLTVHHSPTLKAISNGEILKSEAVSGVQITTFATSPKMSTYLLNLVLGKFEMKEVAAGSVKVRVHARSVEVRNF